MEYSQFLSLLSNYLPSVFDKNTDFKEYLQTEVSLEEYADLFVMTLPDPRTKYYESSNYDKI